jgi:hypothetical protein
MMPQVVTMHRSSDTFSLSLQLVASTFHSMHLAPIPHPPKRGQRGGGNEPDTLGTPVRSVLICPDLRDEVNTLGRDECNVLVSDFLL